MSKSSDIRVRLMNAPLPSLTLLVVAAAEEMQRMEEALVNARALISEIDSGSTAYTPRVVEALKAIDAVLGERECCDHCCGELE